MSQKITPEQRILKLIDAMDAPDQIKDIYREVVCADINVLWDTGCDRLVKGIKADGIWFFMNDEGGLIDLRDYITPHAVGELIELAERRKRAETFTTGQDYFDRLKSTPPSPMDLRKDCAAMPELVQREFIIAVANSLVDESKARRILQEAIDKSVAKPKPHPLSQRSRYDRFSDDDYGQHNDVMRNINYVLNVLNLSQALREPITSVLYRCLKNLKERIDLSQYMPANQLVASTSAPKSSADRPLRPDEQLAADALKKMLGL